MIKIQKVKLKRIIHEEIKRSSLHEAGSVSNLSYAEQFAIIYEDMKVIKICFEKIAKLLPFECVVNMKFYTGSDNETTSFESFVYGCKYYSSIEVSLRANVENSKTRIITSHSFHNGKIISQLNSGNGYWEITKDWISEQSECNEFYQLDDMLRQTIEWMIDTYAIDVKSSVADDLVNFNLNESKNDIVQRSIDELNVLLRSNVLQQLQQICEKLPIICSAVIAIRSLSFEIDKIFVYDEQRVRSLINSNVGFNSYIEIEPGEFHEPGKLLTQSSILWIDNGEISYGDTGECVSENTKMWLEKNSSCSSFVEMDERLKMLVNEFINDGLCEVRPDIVKDVDEKFLEGKIQELQLRVLIKEVLSLEESKLRMRKNYETMLIIERNLNMIGTVLPYNTVTRLTLWSFINDGFNVHENINEFLNDPRFDPRDFKIELSLEIRDENDVFQAILMNIKTTKTAKISMHLHGKKDYKISKTWIEKQAVCSTYDELDQIIQDTIIYYFDMGLDIQRDVSVNLDD